MLSFKPTFSLSSFTFIKRLFSSSSLSGVRLVSPASLNQILQVSFYPFVFIWVPSEAETEEELKDLLMKVKVESEKVGLKLNIQKSKIMASSPMTSWQIDGETMGKKKESIHSQMT